MKSQHETDSRAVRGQFMSAHRSSSRKGTGVIVVGAGIVGLCTAWHLMRCGAQVTVVDPGEPGGSCSSGNAGAISPGSIVPLAMPGTIFSASCMLLDPSGPLHIPGRYWLKALPWLLRFVSSARGEQVIRTASALNRLLKPAIESHKQILNELGAADLIRQSGQLYIYRNARQFHRDKAIWALREHYGVRMERLCSGELRELEPDVSDAYQIGVYLPDQAMSLNPLRQAQTIASGISRFGGRIRQERVTRLLHEGNRITGVQTDRGRIDADHVVICAGAWSADFLRPIGYHVPLESQRGYHISFRDTGISISRPVIPADRKVFISPLETGLRVAGTVEIAGLTAPPNARRASLLHKDLRAVFPQACLANGGSPWMGHRPCFPDSLPAIGAAPRHSGLWFGFGHGHLGLTSAARTGEILAQSIIGGRPPFDLSPYSIERFERGGREVIHCEETETMRTASALK